jgi:hypothetical protein
MSQTTFQPSFAAGELSPELGHRVDLQKYSIGAAKIKNMYVLPRGGLRSRTGTKYIASTKDSTKASRLVEFVFSTTQAYMLEFGDYYIRFYKDGGQVTSGASAYEVITPYPLADIWGLRFEQSADTLYIVHNNHAPRKLTRTGHTAWTLELCEFTNGPLMNENTTDITLTLSDADSNGWVLKDESTIATASAALFNASHVGSIWGIRYVAYAATYTTSFVAGIAFISDSYKTYGDWEIIVNPNGYLDEANVFIEKSVDEGTTWFKLKTIAPTASDTSTRTVTGSESSPCYLRITRPNTLDAADITVNISGQESWACFKVSGFTSPTVVTATMQTDFNKPITNFKSWAEGNWSDYRGWPGAICFFQNRLVFAGTKHEPNGIWPSVIDDYENFQRDIPQVDDNAIYQRLVGRQVNAVKWLVPIKALVCLTDSSEWTIQTGPDGSLTYDSMKLDQQTYWGTNEQVEPVVLGNSVVFSQRNSGQVRSIGYDYSVDGYTGSDLSVMAQHLFDGYEILDWSFQQTPVPILWAVRSDGALLSFTFHKEHDVWAWAQHYTDGIFESVACIPGDKQDDIYFVVKRTIGGTDKRFVEIFASRDVTSNAKFFGVDCGASQTYETPTSMVSGLTWLEGKQVKVLADGVISTKTVSSGSIVLDKAASLVTVGLGFDWLFKSLQVDLGNTTDRKKSINGVSLTVLGSQGGHISTSESGPFVSLPYPLSQTALYSGDLHDITLITGWDYSGQVVIKGEGTLPFHLTTLMPQVNIGGK